MNWRKKFVRSSLLMVNEKFTCGAIKQQNIYPAGLALMLSVASMPYVQSAELKQ